MADKPSSNHLIRVECLLDEIQEPACWLTCSCNWDAKLGYEDTLEEANEIARKHVKGGGTNDS